MARHCIDLLPPFRFMSPLPSVPGARGFAIGRSPIPIQDPSGPNTPPPDGFHSPSANRYNFLALVFRNSTSRRRLSTLVDFFPSRRPSSALLVARPAPGIGCSAHPYSAIIFISGSNVFLGKFDIPEEMRLPSRNACREHRS